MKNKLNTNNQLYQVKLQPTNISRYDEFMSKTLKKNILKLAKECKNIQIAHLNATAIGGGVAETLRHMIPIMLGLGQNVSWYVMENNLKLFRITKSIHNYIHGQDGLLSAKDKTYYLKCNQELAEYMDSIPANLWVIHDPQPLACAYFMSRDNCKKVWYCHIDPSAPEKNTWDFLAPFFSNYQHFIFSTHQYIPQEIPSSQITIFTPAIDPLSQKNILISKEKIKNIIALFDIDTIHPLITQVSRFDPWKDPWGVIDAYLLAKSYIPKLQLAFVAQLATDDPEGKIIYKKIQDFVSKDKNIRLIVNAKNNDLVVNAFQRGSDIIIQKSLREGFGQTVTEAMWKRKAVIGGDTTGIRVQIDSGYNGYLVKTPLECAKIIVKLINTPKLRKDIGVKAHQKVRQNFLLPRLILDYLFLFTRLCPPTNN